MAIIKMYYEISAILLVVVVFVYYMVLLAHISIYHVVMDEWAVVIHVTTEDDPTNKRT